MNLKITKIKPETDYALSLILEKPIGFHFYPGQYIDYELDAHDPSGNIRSFTISASPSEDFLMLTTKEGRSEFKNRLFKLKPNDKISSSPPVGTFILDELSPAVFIAGGVGITPFRSMIKYALDQKLIMPISLIYSNSDENFIFKEELDSWQKLMPNLKIIYYNSTVAGHLSKLPPTTYNPALPAGRLSTIFYLSGPPKFVDAMQKILIDMKIDETNIRSDYFDGYE